MRRVAICVFALLTVGHAFADCPAPDDTAPTVAMQTPTQGANVKAGRVLTMRAGASDDAAVARVRFYVGGMRRCTDTTPPYTCDWTPPVPGRYTLRAVAYDTGNNAMSTAVVINARW